MVPSSRLYGSWVGILLRPQTNLINYFKLFYPPPSKKIPPPPKIMLGYFGNFLDKILPKPLEDKILTEIGATGFFLKSNKSNKGTTVVPLYSYALTFSRGMCPQFPKEGDGPQIFPCPLRCLGAWEML